MKARHGWKAVCWLALAAFGLVAPQLLAHGESADPSSGVVLTQGEAIQPAVSRTGTKPAGGGEGCPDGTFKPLFKTGCAKPSADSRLPLNDSEPMRFEVLRLSKSIAFLQATGTITKETPAEFARFMATDGAKLSVDLNIHSPGGDVRAAMELGRAIRAAHLNTSIERSIPLEGAMRVYRAKDPVCAAACAYAFLGGLSRSYSAEARYSLPRSAASGDAASYLDELGIDPRLLQAAASAPAKDDGFVVPSAQGKDLHVIFDASGLTTFTAEARGGKTVAAFEFTDRGHKYGGLLACDQGQRVLTVLDTEESVHPVLRIMNEFPAEFDANGQKIEGTATYVGRTELSPARILFRLPSLDERSFSGSGVVLKKLTNPQLSPDGFRASADSANRGLLDALSWGDAESSLLFRIAADNGERVLSAVFRGCQ
jgi:hypothetical protein